MAAAVELSSGTLDDELSAGTLDDERALRECFGDLPAVHDASAIWPIDDVPSTTWTDGSTLPPLFDGGVAVEGLPLSAERGGPRDAEWGPRPHEQTGIERCHPCPSTY